MRRREFIAGLSGAAACSLAGTLVASADAPLVGFISSSTTQLDSPLIKALQQGLSEHGYEEGKNIRIEYGFARSTSELPILAKQLVDKRVALILAAGSEAIVAAREVTKSIPIVMTNSGDAVREGFVTSLRAPGGNITGMTQISPELVGKRLEILKEIFPGLDRVGILWNPNHPNTPITYEEARAASVELGLEPVSVAAQEPAEIGSGLNRIRSSGLKALLVIRDPFTVRHRATIIQALNELRLLAIFETSDDVEAGGLMAYGADFEDLFRRSAMFVDRILKGAQPASLPVQQPTKVLFVINNRVAQDRNITLPVSVLTRADRVIE